jgi:hypothetical protein
VYIYIGPSCDTSEATRQRRSYINQEITIPVTLTAITTVAAQPIQQSLPWTGDRLCENSGP